MSLSYFILLHLLKIQAILSTNQVNFTNFSDNWPNHPTQSLVGLSMIKIKKAASPKRGAVVPPTIRAWPYKPSQALPGLPYWPEHEDDYEIAKMFLLVKGDNFFSIELHVIQKQRPQQPQHQQQQQTSTPRLYIVFTHEGSLRGLDGEGYERQKECRYLENLPEAEAIFTHFFDSRIALGYKYLSSPPPISEVLSIFPFRRFLFLLQKSFRLACFAFLCYPSLTWSLFVRSNVHPFIRRATRLAASRIGSDKAMKDTFHARAFGSGYYYPCGLALIFDP